jgi:hypothetical protein
LITNIVLVWNTVYQQAIIRQLHQEGYVVDENDFEFIAPALFEHIKGLGKYFFTMNPIPGKNGPGP